MKMHVLWQDKQTTDRSGKECGTKKCCFTTPTEKRSPFCGHFIRAEHDVVVISFYSTMRYYRLWDLNFYCKTRPTPDLVSPRRRKEPPCLVHRKRNERRRMYCTINSTSLLYLKIVLYIYFNVPRVSRHI
jgi:hypothetical protein